MYLKFKGPLKIWETRDSKIEFQVVLRPVSRPKCCLPKSGWFDLIKSHAVMIDYLQDIRWQGMAVMGHRKDMYAKLSILFIPNIGLR